MLISTGNKVKGSDLCPSGWYTSDDVGNCYQIRLYDSNFGLAAITSQHEDLFLINLLLR